VALCMIQIINMNRGGAYYPIKDLQDLDKIRASLNDSLNQLAEAIENYEKASSDLFMKMSAIKPK